MMKPVSNAPQDVAVGTIPEEAWVVWAGWLVCVEGAVVVVGVEFAEVLVATPATWPASGGTTMVSGLVLSDPITTVVVALLLPGIMSRTVPETVAVSEKMVPVEVARTLAAIWSAALAPLESDPTFQMPVVLAKPE